MERANITTGKNRPLLDGLVKKYESKIKELQRKVQESTQPSKELLQRTNDLQNLGEDLKNELAKVNHLYNRLEQLIGATQTSILFLDEDLRIQRYTRELKSVFGDVEFTPGELISDVIDFSTFQKLYKHIKKVGPQPEQQETEFYLRKSDKWFQTHIFPFPETVDTKPGYVITFLDVTKHKEYEKKLNQLTKRLEREIKKKNERLKDLASEIMVAEQKERKRISVLLHNDLQQQLFSIQTKAKMLNDEMPEKYSEKLDHIIEQVGQSLQLTHQLVVSLSPPNIEDNDLAKGIKWIGKYVKKFHSLEVHFEDKLELKLKSKDVYVLILQVIQELLFNVVKHAGVEKATILVQEKKAVIQIHVVDKGKGFDEEVIDEMDSFGLSQIKEQVELLDGQLITNSTPGEGTDMVLSIPKDHFTIKTEV